MILSSQLCLSETCSSGNQYRGESHFPFMKEFTFGSGVIVGTLSKADFYLGQNQINNVFFFEILTEDESISELEEMDGIVGLGFNLESSKTFLEYIVEQKKIPNVFSVYLNREDDAKKSKIIFGGYQKNLIKSEPKYYDVNDETYWALDLEGIFVGDNDTGLCSKEKVCRAVIDTGTSFLASSTPNILQIASNMINILFFNIFKLGFIEVEGNCDNFDTLPEIK